MIEWGSCVGNAPFSMILIRLIPGILMIKPISIFVSLFTVKD